MVLLSFCQTQTQTQTLFPGLRLRLVFSCETRLKTCDVLKTERELFAAPRTPRAQRYVITQSLGPQANVCDDFRHACAFILHV